MFQMRIRPSNKTFIERFVRMAVFFGIPMCLFELIGAPRNLWVSILEFVVPPIMAGVLVLTIIEYCIMRVVRRRQQNAGQTPDQSS
jgi:hypothetical protein